MHDADHLHGRRRSYRDLRAALGASRAYDLVGGVALSTSPLTH